ncbi:unnamed protein product, partial [Prorocentrum cordatum]
GRTIRMPGRSAPAQQQHIHHEAAGPACERTGGGGREARCPSACLRPGLASPPAAPGARLPAAAPCRLHDRGGPREASRSGAAASTPTPRAVEARGLQRPGGAAEPRGGRHDDARKRAPKAGARGCPSPWCAAPGSPPPRTRPGGWPLGGLGARPPRRRRRQAWRPMVASALAGRRAVVASSSSSSSSFLSPPPLPPPPPPPPSPSPPPPERTANAPWSPPLWLADVPPQPPRTTDLQPAAPLLEPPRAPVSAPAGSANAVPLRALTSGKDYRKWKKRRKRDGGRDRKYRLKYG